MRHFVVNPAYTTIYSVPNNPRPIPLRHLDRIGAHNHDLYRVVRDAANADHALRVHAMYAKHEAEKRAEEKAR